MPLIGKTTQVLAYDISELKNRFIKYDLTRLLKGKSMLLTLKTNVQGDKVSTSPKRIMLMPYFLKRAVRKGTNYVEDSFSAECKDEKIRIKPFLVTRRKVSRAVRKALREKAKEELLAYIKDKPLEQIFDDLIKNQLQKSLSLKLKKIYPLSTCEIRVLEIEKR